MSFSLALGLVQSLLIAFYFCVVLAAGQMIVPFLRDVAAISKPLSKQILIAFRCLVLILVLPFGMLSLSPIGCLYAALGAAVILIGTYIWFVTHPAFSGRHDDGALLGSLEDESNALDKPTRDSKTATACNCDWFEHHSIGPNSPVKFNPHHDAYEFVYSEGGFMIYHCPFCGGVAPKPGQWV